MNAAPNHTAPRTLSALLSRLRAAVLHLTISAAVATLAALLVFGLWFPTPFREISGGRELFFIVIAVDVVLGPVITFAIFDRRKQWRELRRDLAVVGLLQLGGMAYGLHTVDQVRPAFLALENTRLRVVRVIDLQDIDLSSAPAEFRQVSFWGVKHVAARKVRPEEKAEALKLGLQGRDVGMRPELWLPAAATPIAYAQAAQPLSKLRDRFPQRAHVLDAAVVASGHSADQLGFLPILARRTDWSALVDLRSGDIVGYVAIEGF